MAAHRLVVHLGVVEPGQEMDCARARRGQTDTGGVVIGELGEAAGHEPGHLLVTRLDELETVSGTVEGSEDAIDAITGVSEDGVNPHSSSRSSRWSATVCATGPRNGRSHLAGGSGSSATRSTQNSSRRSPRDAGGSARQTHRFSP